MKLKEALMNVCSDKYQCLECEDVNGVKVITIGTEEEPYILNFEFGDTTISVNVIDKCEGSVVDEYEDTYDENTLTDCLSNAVMTYESIVKHKSAIKEAQETKAQREKFDAILADGSPEAFMELTKSELLALDDYIEAEVESDVGKRFAHFAVNLALKNIQVADVNPQPSNRFTLGDKVAVDGADKVGTLVDRLYEDPMDSAVGCDSGDFDAWVIEYEDGTKEMCSEDHLTLVESTIAESSNDNPKLGKKIKQLKGWKIYEGTNEYGETVFRCFTPQESRPAVGYEDWEADTFEQAISWIENYDLDENKLPVTEDVNTLSNRVDIPCTDDITLVMEVTACENDNYKADYIAGLQTSDSVGFMLDGKSVKNAHISDIYHDILTIKFEEENNTSEYRVDAKNCLIDFSKNQVIFNDVISNDVPGEWYAFLKLKGSLEDIKKDVKIALTESLEIPEESGQAESIASNNITDGDVNDNNDALNSASLSQLLYAASQKLLDAGIAEEDEVAKKVLEDLSAELEQIITELSGIVEDK